MLTSDSIENEPQINADERRFDESVSMDKGCMGLRF